MSNTKNTKLVHGSKNKMEYVVQCTSNNKPEIVEEIPRGLNCKILAMIKSRGLQRIICIPSIVAPLIAGEEKKRNENPSRWPGDT
jgi:hypothetical protein